MREKEQGVALVLVLLIFSIMTVLSARLVTDVQHNAARITRYTQNLQARHYAMGAEQFAAVLLEEDVARDRSTQRLVDHLHESWALPQPQFETESGDIELVILDDQGRFNLNMLADPADKRRKEALQMLVRLLDAQGLDVRLAYRIQDWVDGDQIALTSGAEDAVYIHSSPPHRTADTALASVSELRLMDVLSPEEFERLLPLVSVLPTSDGININTASADVLRALSRRISQGDAESFVDGRGKAGFSRTRDALRHPALSGRVASSVADHLGVTSRFFSVYIKARYQDSVYYLHSRLARTATGQVTVIARETGSFPRWVRTRQGPEG